MSTPLIRLWPGVVAALLLCVLRFGLPLVAPEYALIGMMGGLGCAVLILVWWLFFSRAPWLERIGAIVWMVAVVTVMMRVVHVSIRGGMMGMMLPAYSIFVLMPALVAGVAIARGRSAGFRRAAIAGAILIAGGSFGLLRTGGILGGTAELAWRWSKTPEEILLATERAQLPPPAPMTAPAPATAPAVGPAGSNPLRQGYGGPPELHAKAEDPASITTASIRQPEWPGFRGPNRDDVVRGVRIGTDWAASPPVKLWSRPIGPGWSSFAVNGEFLYTQEQRGDDEIVTSYKVATGEPVWQHRDAARFWESNGGPGPRATPTLSNGRVYTFGATGILNVLDAANGALIWSRDVASEAKVKVPMWGFASSPLVVNDVVIVGAFGKLAGFDRATGALRWTGPSHTGSYSSPHLATIDGVEQVLLLSSDGATSVAPADGRLLWDYAWPEGGSTIVQPALTADGDVLINSIAATGGLGIRRLALKHAAEKWAVQERWTSTGLKPYFNDFVVHKGHAFGFDGSILSCIDLADGARKWKGGRYGDGQLVLLSDQDLLLVISEEGELALVSATPDQFKEIARFRAIDGKTWNHPVVVGDTLLIRNGEEMAAFRLPRAGK